MENDSVVVTIECEKKIVLTLGKNHWKKWAIVFVFSYVIRYRCCTVSDCRGSCRTGCSHAKGQHKPNQIMIDAVINTVAENFSISVYRVEEKGRIQYYRGHRFENST